MKTEAAPHFERYWHRIQLRQRAMSVPAPCLYWRRSESLNQVERFIWQRVKDVDRILDYGAGDQALRQKFLAAGYRGSYETFDVSPEFETTWRDPEAIRGPFGAVLCLEVIEHMSLSEGLALRDRLLSFVQPGGWLVLSTPNPACIISPFSRDETHLQLYPLHDLITWALAAGLDVEARRVKLLPDRVTLKTRVQMAAQRVICYLTGADRADGLIVISSRPR